MPDDRTGVRWLLLIHHLPPKPAALRLRVWRRMQKHGAIAIKNTVYVLPDNESCRETFEWTLREIHGAGGEAYLCDARFLGGLDDRQIERLFRDARAADYREIASEAREVSASLRRRDQTDHAPQARAAAARLRRRLGEIAATDVVGAPGRDTAVKAVGALERKIDPGRGAVPSERPPRGAVWVTRTGVHVDRIASAWLIRRFLDPEATFKFVPARRYEPSH